MPSGTAFSFTISSEIEIQAAEAENESRRHLCRPVEVKGRVISICLGAPVISQPRKCDR
jgi:hypothetical protein